MAHASDEGRASPAVAILRALALGLLGTATASLVAVWILAHSTVWLGDHWGPWNGFRRLSPVVAFLVVFLCSAAVLALCRARTLSGLRRVLCGCIAVVIGGLGGLVIAFWEAFEIW